MTAAEALLVFVVEVTRASKEVGGIGPVRVVLADLPAGVRAETVPGEIRLAYDTAFRATRARNPRPWLRCIARHEVAHRALDHRPRTRLEVKRNEAEIPRFLLTVWNEGDALCNARLR
jgi:hypothetical protein